MKRVTVIATAVALFLTLGFLSGTGHSATVNGKELAGQLNINTATAEELALLPQIGPKTAERIIEYRTTNGPFKKIEDLKNVKGIGDKKFSRFASHIKVSGNSDLRLAS